MKTLFLGALAAVALAGGANAQVRTDYHMHVHSPAILKMLPAYCASPGRKGACDARFTEPLTVDDLLAQMDKAGVQHGWLMSTAYLARSPMMVPALPDAAQITRDANDFTVGLARAHPDRLSTFIGLNPLAPDALDEIARWKGDCAVTGLKLHLTNSEVDLRDPAQVAKLAAVFKAAAGNGWTIMIHMRTRAADYGAQDVRVFLKDVLPAAGEQPVVLAHAAGWGGIDAVTLDALGAFADALKADPSRGRNLRFDLAQVMTDKTTPQDRAKLAALIRRIGPDHFLAASDWPFAGDLKAYFAKNFARPELTHAEWAQVLNATVPEKTSCSR